VGSGSEAKRIEIKINGTHFDRVKIHELLT